MRKDLPPVFFGLILVLFASSGSATTYYIAANGSDSNNGTSNATAWLHAPGMKGCTATCSSTSPQAGDRFILRGGDTWGSTSFVWVWPTGGSSASVRTYIGVDQSYYNSTTCGSTWCRPIMDCQNTCNKQFQLATGVNFVQIDNIEWKGLFDNSSSPGFDQIFSVDVHNGIQGNSAADVILSNNYFHGWSVLHDGTQDSTAVLWATSGDTHSQAYGNVWDGSDATGNAPHVMMAIYGDVAYTYQNVCRYIANCFIQGNTASFHDNLLEYVYVSVDTATHSNAFESNADCNFVAYGNIFRHIETASFVQFQMSPNSGCTSYAFNNLMYDTQAGNGMQCFEGGGGGTCQFFNNTAQCGVEGSSNLTCGRATGNDPGVWTNNHFITSSNPPIAGSAVTLTNNVIQTEAVANGQGYTASEMFVFFPTTQTDATVNAGSPMATLCATISVINQAAGVACTSDASYAVAYDSTTHTVTFPVRSTNPRPTGTASWNAGAYQFLNGGPAAPSGLFAVVN